MPSFKDSNGREWLIKLDAPTVKEVRTALDFDLLADDAFGKLATDDLLLVDTLWIICRSQAGVGTGAASGNMTDREFGQSLANGDAIESAAQALIQARRDFFRPGKRSLLRSLEEEQAAILSQGMAKVQAKISDPTLRTKLLAQMDDQITRSLASIFGPASSGPPSATSLPDSAASSPPA